MLAPICIFHSWHIYLAIFNATCNPHAQIPGVELEYSEFICLPESK